MSEPAAPDRLARRLGTADAVIIGLGAMVGAGIFAVLAPAARAAGGALLVALGIAAMVAWCNATSSARLAALYPESGGTYVYARRRLGAWPGFLAGWGFVVGKTASCAAMALTLGAYAAPDAARPVALGAVAALTALNLLGVHRTAAATRVIVAVVIGVLVALVASVGLGGHADLGRAWSSPPHSARGVLEAAGLLFFAFAGYARIATLGEEVRDPARTIPRAIPLALGLALALYAVVALAALSVLGPERLADASAPLAAVAAAAGGAVPAWLVRVAAAIASGGVLLSLLAGVSRTTLAMARDRELPGTLDAVHPIRRVPHRAELAVGVAVAVLVATTDLRGAIGFSSFTVLGYYALANASAWTLGGRGRAVAALGLAGCVVLAFSLPASSVAAGAAVLALGALGRVASWRRGRPALPDRR